MRFELVSFGVVALVLAGCGGVAQSDLFGEAGAPEDAGAPPAKEGGHVTIVQGDAGADVGKVTMADTQGGVPDSHTVTPTPDASTTPVPEAATPVDTGPPTPPVQCLNGPCSGATPVCCVTEGGGGASGTCTATAADCSGEGTLPISCESSSACNGGICCATTFSYNGQTYPTAIACSPKCNGNNETPLCAVGGMDCPQGQNCNGFEGAPYGTCGQF
jgi:hypothetical protein